jgi:hypothetical protein
VTLDCPGGTPRVAVTGTPPFSGDGGTTEGEKHAEASRGSTDDDAVVGGNGRTSQRERFQRSERRANVLHHHVQHVPALEGLAGGVPLGRLFNGMAALRAVRMP